MYINKEKLYSWLYKVNGFPYDGICDLYIFIIEAKASFVSSEGGRELYAHQTKDIAMG